MAGELVLQRMHIGKQIAEGDPVAATRVVYVDPESEIVRDRASRPWRFMTGSPDNVRAHTQGPVEAGGTISMPVSADELDEWLECTVGVPVLTTPSDPSGAVLTRLRTYKPSPTVNVMSIERMNGAQNEQGVGMRGMTLTIEGSASEENKATFELIGLDVINDFGALTSGLTERTPNFFEGWQTNFFIDSFGGTPGTTQITDMLLGWTITLNKPLEREYTARNSLAAFGLNFGDWEITAELKVRAAAATMAAEILKADTDVKRMLRFEFLGPANGIEAGFRRFVTMDIPGAWTSPGLNEDNALARAYTMPFTYIYDPVLAAGLVVRTQNGRATTF